MKRAVMVDRLSREARSAHMSRIKAKDTAPELTVRRLLHAMGYRFRIHRRELPGTPDIVFPSRRKLIFVHGCFWHGHGCPLGTLPKSRLEFWTPKIRGNRARDLRNLRALRRANWSVSELWQCQIGDELKLKRRLRRFIETSRSA